MFKTSATYKLVKNKFALMCFWAKENRTIKIKYNEEKGVVKVEEM